jgi:UDP-N-acetylglucosamine 2-epimerase (non-hydrolysing)
MVTRISTIIITRKIQAIMVLGDTNSTLAGALAGFYNRIPVFHVEAGLRSDNTDHPWPEETNRRLVTQLATYHFAPTYEDLNHVYYARGPGRRDYKVWVTGNPVIDAVRLVRERGVAVAPADIAKYLREHQDKRLVVATCHRYENRETGISWVAEQLKEMAEEQSLVVVWPRHSNPIVNRQLEPYSDDFYFCDPLSYPHMIAMLEAADVVVTDSGGLQEECHYLRRPIIVCRETTERTCLLRPSAPGHPRNFVLVPPGETSIFHSCLREMLRIGRNRLTHCHNRLFGDGDTAASIVRMIKRDVVARSGV